MRFLLPALAGVLALAAFFGLYELVRPAFIRWERRCAIGELRCYQTEFEKERDPRMKLYWAEVIRECRARHRFRLGELPD